MMVTDILLILIIIIDAARSQKKSSRRHQRRVLRGWRGEECSAWYKYSGTQARAPELSEQFIQHEGSGAKLYSLFSDV